MYFELIAASGFFNFNMLGSIAQMVIGIGLIIFVHELGHFLAAKACGVKCEKFYVGFDAFDLNLGVLTIPRRLAYFHWGETEYGIGILPLGGYVKMLGQHDNPVEAVSDPAASRQSAELPSQAPAVAAAAQSQPRIDPRSYLAKTVPQRMLIISAGVVMNMIFAVIFATIAFGLGVSYEPPVVGHTMSGSPAWEKNLSGAEILKINGTDTQDRYFSFMNLMETIMVGGSDQDITLEIRRPQTVGQVEPLSVRPVTGINPLRGFDPPALGIRPMTSCLVGLEHPTIQGRPAHQAGFEAGDLIIKINDVVVQNRVDLGRELAPLWDQTIQMTVLRNTDQVYFSYQEYLDAGRDDGEQIVLEVGPNPMLEYGMAMEFGPIIALQMDSPAYQAGLKVGDRLLAIDDQPIDPLFVSQMLRQAAREVRAVKIDVQRSEGDESQLASISVIPRFPNGILHLKEDLPMAIDELGIAVFVTNRVERVEEDSPAQRIGIQPGDQIVGAALQYRQDDVLDGQLEELKKMANLSPAILEQNWWLAHEQLQNAFPSAYWALTVQRDDQTLELELDPVVSTRYFLETRGLTLQPLKQVYRAESIADALRCGAGQVWADTTKVLTILKQMVTGKVPMTALGGIGTIAIGATSEAMSGTARLLLFLTLLSVNLAILNFLPIPILDGGHMVFLAYEGVTGQPPNERIQEALTMIGALLLLALIIFALGLDAWRIAGLFS